MTPGREILTAEDTESVLETLRGMSDADRRALAEAARRRILEAHTAEHRAAELEGHLQSVARRLREPRTAPRTPVPMTL